jgi:DNA repair protein SbcD/Mre11
MSLPPVSVLFLSDSHLGFDLPQRPRVQRRRRGPDFFRCFDHALETALSEGADLIIHGGDLFYRSRVSAALVLSVIERIRNAANRVPVLIVPGNHERSALPLPLLWGCPGVYVFDRPRTHVFEVKGMRLAVSGFPYDRSDLRRSFANLVEATGWRAVCAGARLLCVHQLVEGMRVGPSGYRFTDAPDVIPARMLPRGFAAVLAGHIHRAQVLTRDGRGSALAAPVFCAGSTERTSAAERNERKGCLWLAVDAGCAEGGVVRRWRFRELPTGPLPHQWQRRAHAGPVGAHPTLAP